MTQEEKAKRYDEVIKKAKEYYEEGKTLGKTLEYVDDLVSDIFPELKESEDERIKEAIIATIHLYYGEPLEDEAKEMIAWLEKQGEQKGYTFKSIPRLLDMIEPSDKANRYCQKLIDALAKEGYNTDAKIVEEVLKGWNGEDVPMTVMDEQKPVFEIKTPEESLGIDSATYNKIVDECIYGEQKPTDKIEPFDEYEGLTDFERTLADICIGWIGEEIGWKQYIKDNADVLLKIAVEKFNSVQDTSFEQKPTDNDMKEALRTEYEKGRADAIAEMNNPAWSEEDESNLDSAIYHIRREPYRAKDVEPIVDWLESLKERIKKIKL